MNTHPIDAWHKVLRDRDPRRLGELLADDAVFHSPVVRTPQVGKALTQAYLMAAFAVLAVPSFRYQRQVIGERDAALEFVLELDGLQINGVDLIHWNDDGLIDDFKVMLRPLKAVNLIHRRMGEMLAGRD